MQTRKNINKQFLRLFVPAAAIFGLIVGYFYFSEVEKERIVREANEDLHLNLGKQVIEKDLEAAFTDLRVLSHHREFDKIEVTPGPEALKHLARAFLVFAQNKRHYDQIRFLDETGKEVIRINLGSARPYIVPEDQLQDKSRRYYFANAMRLKKGEILISPLDLNIEHGIVEKPVKSVIRLTTPVFYGQGKKRGIVVLNYLGSNLMRDFKEAAAGIADHAMLLDTDGFWMYGPRPELEWGSQLGHGLTFKKQFPEAWKQVTDADTGRFYNSDGLFTFDTVYPLRLVWKSSTGATVADEPSRSEVAGKEYYWKVVTHVPNWDLDAAATAIAMRLLLIAVPLFGLLVAGGFWLAHARVRRLEAEEVLKEKTELVNLLHEITIAANETSNVDEAMQICLDKVCDYTGWEVGHAYVFDSEGILMPTELWRIADQHRFKAFCEIAKSITFTPGVGLPGRVLESGKPVWLPDVTQDQNFLRVKEAVKTGLKAAFAFPVLEGEKTVAVLTFFTTERVEPDESLLKAIENLATQLGRVTERKRAEKDLEKRIAYIKLLQEVAVKANESESIEEALQYCIDRVCALTLWPVGHVYMVSKDDPDELTPTTIWRMGVVERFRAFYDATSKTKFMRGVGLPGRVLESGTTAWIADITKDANFPRAKAVKEIGVRAAFAFPVVVREKVAAVLEFFSTEFSEPAEDLINIMTQVGTQVGRVIERKQAEEEKAQLQRQLQQAQKMEAVGQLTGGIAHDFNNILAAILGYTELALERCAEDGNGKLTQYLQQVDHAGKQARNLIAQMLAFSRGGAVKPEPMPMQPLLKESLKMLGSTLPSSIELQMSIEDNIPQAMMDPVHLHQMVMNLCINARDAMKDHGHIDIQLHTLRDLHVVCDSCHAPARGDFVELAVTDTGSGIEPEVLTRVFDPFFTTKEVGRGSGMGLAMVHGIVHELGGHIRVKTAPGKGSIFRLLFPVDTGGGEAMESKREETIPPSVQGNGGHILVVDDEASVAGFLGELIASRGYQVTVQTDSRQALARFGKNPQRFDLVMTDQTMPKLTGAELAQAMLKLRPELPVILCTGYSEHMDEEHARALGIRGFLSKPLETRVLMDLVRELLESRVTNSEAVTSSSQWSD